MSSGYEGFTFIRSESGTIVSVLNGSIPKIYIFISPVNMALLGKRSLC